MHRLHTLASLTALVLLPSLAPVSSQEAPGPRFARVFLEGRIDERLHGLWKSRGYGWVAHLDEHTFEVFDHGSYGTRRVDMDMEELLDWVGWFSREGDTIVLTTSPENSTRLVLDRIDALTAGADDPPADDPESVFDYFWACMDEHFAFFELHEVDWAARRREHRPRVGPETSDAELFDVLSDMLRGIRDAHLGLGGEIDGTSRSFECGEPVVLWPALRADFEARGGRGGFAAHADRWLAGYRDRLYSKVLFDGHHVDGDGRVVWGRIGAIGYLNIRSMGGFSDSDALEVELPEVHATMTRVVEALADCDGLIVDVTVNTGGYDDVQLAIASHFAADPVVAYTKYAADSPVAVEPQTFELVPAREGRFLGPVALVTSDFTVSAAETFTLAMRALPNVTHWGMATRGSLSDMLEKRLPNDWVLTLSNEVYLDADGHHWERIGIPPERPVPVFDPAKLDTSHADAILSIADELHAAN